MWYTTWIIILIKENHFTGHIMLKGYPNENGEVTIGYWIQNKYKRKGYMKKLLLYKLQTNAQNNSSLFY